MIANAIKAMNTDIVTLEEVEQKTTRSNGLDQAKIIAEKTGMHYVFGKATEVKGGNYGNVIFPNIRSKKIKFLYCH